MLELDMLLLIFIVLQSCTIQLLIYFSPFILRPWAMGRRPIHDLQKPNKITVGNFREILIFKNSDIFKLKILRKTVKFQA